MNTKKDFDLCKCFKMPEGKHFWLSDDNMSNEYYIKKNALWLHKEESEICIIPDFKYVSNNSIYFLNNRTKEFLKLLNKDYKYLGRDSKGNLFAFVEEPIIRYSVFKEALFEDESRKVKIDEKAFDIDFSCVKKILPQMDTLETICKGPQTKETISRKEINKKIALQNSHKIVAIEDLE